jgi:hypothetical protein
MNEYDVTQQYGFTYTDCNGKEYTKTIKTAGCTWFECMDDYVKFLESVFGYAIQTHVRLEEPSWLGNMHEHYHDYIDPWTGEYFVKEEEITLEDLWSDEE